MSRLRGERLAQRAGSAVGAGHRFVAGGAEGGDARRHQRRIVRRGEADRVARLVGQPGLGQVDDDVAHVLGRPRSGQRLRGQHADGPAGGLGGAGWLRPPGRRPPAPRRGTASAAARWPCRRARRARWRPRAPRPAPRYSSGTDSRTGRSRAARSPPSCAAAAGGPRPASAARPAPGRDRARGSLPPARAAARRAVADRHAARRRRRRARRGSRSARPAAPARTARSPGSAAESTLPLPRRARSALSAG